MADESWKDEALRRIIHAYPPAAVRLYNRLRLFVLRRRMLDEMVQYLPRAGLVLDVGCGFGLFSLYCAAVLPEVRIRGIDISPRRIEMVCEAARRLGLGNVEFTAGDACDFHPGDNIQAICMIDLIHHLPREAAQRLLVPLAADLAPGGRLIIKDIEPRPWHKLAYTWLLDRLVDPRSPLHYWEPAELQQLLEGLGLSVYRHRMSDFLPCPHILYVAEKRPT